VGAEAATGGWAIKSNASPLPPPPPPTITATIEQNGLAGTNGKQSTAYQLTLACVKTPDTSNAGIVSASHLAEVRLTADRAMSGVGSVPLTYDVDGTAGESPQRVEVSGEQGCRDATPYERGTPFAGRLGHAEGSDKQRK
jgi:hypothetical protein